MSWSKALSISEATRALPASAAQAVEAHVLRRAPSQTHANLRRSLRTQVAKYAAKTEADRHREAVAERTCKIVPLSDGMAGLWVVHTADKIQQIWVTIQAMADLAKRGTPTTRPNPHTGTDTDTGTGTDTGSDTDTGTSTGTRRDAGTSTGTTGTDTGTGTTNPTRPPTGQPPITGAPHSGEPRTAGQSPAGEPRTTGQPPTSEPRTTGQPPSGGPVSDAPARDERTAPQRRADVVADVFEYILRNGLDWLGRRLPDQHRRRPHIEVLIPASTLLGLDEDPCELTGYGPIPADMARRIARDGTWRRLLTDPINGSVLEASTTRHDPGALVSETLLARHPVCAWPGCNKTSRGCDRDHGTPFTRSGHTSLAGLAPYCEYHHVIKDTPAWGWSTTNHPDGAVTLTAPTGHRYTTTPPARGPITEPPPTTTQHPHLPPRTPPTQTPPPRTPQARTPTPPIPTPAPTPTPAPAPHDPPPF